MDVVEMNRTPQVELAAGWRFGPYRLESGLLRRDGVVVDLTPKELGVLAVLIEAGGALVTAATLLDRVWANAPVGSSSLHRCVSTLRARLAEGVPGRSAVETLHRRGYRFALPVQPIRPETEGSAAARAEDLVLQAMEFVGHRSPRHLALAERALRAAIALDPACIAAYRMLAQLYVAQALRGYQTPREAGVLARQATQAALALVPDDPEALVLEGWVRVVIEGDPAGLSLVNAAQARAPGNRWVLFYRGYVLAALDQPAAGARSIGEAFAMQPLAPGIAAAHGYIRFCAGDTARALAGLRSASTDMPVNHIIFSTLAIVAAWRGAHDEALAAAEEACRLSDRVGIDLVCLGYALAQAGRRAEAERVLAEVQTAQPPAPVTQLAALHVALGQFDAARRALARAAAECCPYRVLVRHDPRFAALGAATARAG
jgi:DNA-binding winged helix-turn-helix (wHTH) protein/Flp pilus assembly protein TadD